MIRAWIILTEFWLRTFTCSLKSRSFPRLESPYVFATNDRDKKGHFSTWIPRVENYTLLESKKERRFISNSCCVRFLSFHSFVSLRSFPCLILNHNMRKERKKKEGGSRSWWLTRQENDERWGNECKKGWEGKNFTWGRQEQPSFPRWSRHWDPVLLGSDSESIHLL